MKTCRIITLTTDFGYSDPFVGQMKGVILSIQPEASIVDLTHGIPAHDIEQGAFVIASSYSYFPDGSIHVVVVDPGVGSERRGIIVFAGRHYFIGPDNGIFTRIINEAGSYLAAHITNGRYAMTSTGPTFHGRDIFAPAAAWLAKGADLVDFGPAVTDVYLPDMPKPEMSGGGFSGEVIYLDRFGNAITNMRKESLPGGTAFITTVQWKGITVPLISHYAAAEDRGLHALFNSSGYLELFANRESAASLYGIRKGDKVALTLSPSNN
ncbi:MAG: SAM-dependent chlorinase/fluorinase, partial [Syntrophales bacterium]|nr:SAM-dependent chlorinase/fluorinase [Syntrophales bacterium]